MSYLCPRPCQNKNTFGYCLTSWCLYPFIANGGSGIEVISNRTVEPLKPKTNADRIRAMTDEELVFFFWGTVDGSGKTVEQWREWMKQEAKYEQEN